MAVLSQTTGGGLNAYDITSLAPEGVYAARCIDYLERFGVTEEKFNEPGEFVTRDKIRLLFQLSNKNGGVDHLAQTFEMNISGSPKSKLVGFIKGWQGKLPPPGFDTLSLINEVAQVSIAHRTSKKGTIYATIESIAPLMNPEAAPAMDNLLDIPGGARTAIEMEPMVQKMDKPIPTGVPVDAGDDEEPF
mgnify:CR=1 FL=1